MEYGWWKKQIWHCLGRPHISQIQNFGTKIRQNCLCAFEKAILDLFQYIKSWFPVQISSSDILGCHQWITFSEIKERKSVWNWFIYIYSRSYLSNSLDIFFPIKVKLLQEGIFFLLWKILFIRKLEIELAILYNQF